MAVDGLEQRVGRALEQIDDRLVTTENRDRTPTPVERLSYASTYRESVSGTHEYGARGPIELVSMLRVSEFEGSGRPEQVMHQLETAIAVGLIAVGEKLPPERDLAGQLGVTVLQIRHALAGLRERGLIETRRGRGGGSVVCDTSAVSTKEVERRLRERSTDELRDLGDTSGVVSAASARYAASRADGPEVTRLEALADQFAQATSYTALRQADSRFHIGLAIAAQSRRLTTLSLQIQGEIAPLLWIPGRETNRARQFHSDIIRAIAAGDEMAALMVAGEHARTDTETLITARLELMIGN